MRQTIISCLICLCLSAWAAAAQLEVTEGGKSRIYLAFSQVGKGDGSGILPSAIQDFADYFRQLSGAPLPLSSENGLIPLEAVLIESDDLGLFDSDIVVSKEKIVIRALQPIGVVNALYHLLDYWGVRWVMPGELGEVVLKAGNLTLPVGTMAVRIAMDNRVESSWMQGDGHRQWLIRNRRGSEIWLTGQHYWLYALPPAEYFEKHPEYYALIGGKRVPTQLCISNPEVQRLMKEKADEYLLKNPQIGSFPMDPEDNFEHCQCEKCVAFDGGVPTWDGYPNVSDRVAKFNNIVAKSVAGKHPSKLVGYYAYANKKLPPTVALEPNIFVSYTRDSSCLLHLMPDDSCPTSKDYWSMLEEWSKKCDNMYAYEYDPISWIGGLYCPIYVQRGLAIQKLHQMGVKGIMEDMGPRRDAANFLTRYVEVRLEADPGRDVYAEIADMCNRFFGPAGSVMNEYFITMTKVNPKIDQRFGTDVYDQIFIPEIVEQGRALLNRAAGLLKKNGDEKEQKRFKMVELEHCYLEKFLQFFYDLEKRDYQHSLAQVEEIYQSVRNLNAADGNYMDIEDSFNRIRTATLKKLAEYYPDEMGFIRNWQLSPLFDNNRRDAVFAAPFPHFSDGKFELDGKTYEAFSYTALGGDIDLRKAYGDRIKPDSVYYAYAATSIDCKFSREVQVRTDSFNPFKVYLNGKLVYERLGIDADRPDKRIFSVKLKPGRNTVVLLVGQVVLNQFTMWGFWLRFTDSDGKPIDFNLEDVKNVRTSQELAEAKKQLTANKAVNLLQYGNFEEIAKWEYASLGMWPPAEAAKVSLDRTVAKDRQSLKATGVSGGALNRFFPVKPGEKYLVGFEFLADPAGKGSVAMQCTWRSGGKFVENQADEYTFLPQEPANGQWQKVEGVVTVPDNVDEIVYIIALSGQAANESLNIDNAFFYQLK